MAKPILNAAFYLCERKYLFYAFVSVSVLVFISYSLNEKLFFIKLNYLAENSSSVLPTLYNLTQESLFDYSTTKLIAASSSSALPILYKPYLAENEESLYDYSTTKLILTWTQFYGGSYGVTELEWCPNFNCKMTDNRSLINESSAVIFHGRDFNFEDLPKFRYEWQRYIFQLHESPQHTYLDLEKLANFFNWTMTYRRDSDVYAPNGRYFKFENPANSSKLNESQILGFNKRMVAWMVSNCNPTSKREKYVKELQKYITVDIYGHCSYSKYECPKSNWSRCNALVNDNYKFYLAFENSICTDYITEKYFDRVQLNTVAIVLRRKIVEDIFPKNSFIAADDFEHPKYLAAYLKELAQDDKKYLTYFQWKTEGFIKTFPSFDDGFCSLCRKLQKNPPAPKKSLNELHTWWSEGKCDVNFVQKQLGQKLTLLKSGNSMKSKKL